VSTDLSTETDRLERVYLDHAATTPVRPAARRATLAVLDDVTLGNPASLHAAGRAARRVLEESRELVATALQARATEVLFTSGATESLNLALKGLAWQRRDADPARVRILVGATEHHAVLDAAAWLGSDQGFVVEHLMPAADGTVAPVTPGADVAVVAVMWANNETGTVNDIAAWSRVCADAGVPLVVDAVQAVGAVPVTFALPGLTAMAVSGHKLGAPSGSGALLLRSGVTPTSLTHGGGQEREVRSGTVAVSLAAGLAAAVEAAVRAQPEQSCRLEQLRDALVEGVLEVVPDAVVHGGGEQRLPGVLSMGFPGTEGDALLMLLDAAGIACSVGSACTAGVPEPSHVLLAMGIPLELARGSLRFSLGWTSEAAEVERLIAALPAAVARARRAKAATAALRRP
jgi:cysteine desulfurase